MVGKIIFSFLCVFVCKTFEIECKTIKDRRKYSISMILCLFATLHVFTSQIFSFANECFCKKMQIKIEGKTIFQCICEWAQVSCVNAELLQENVNVLQVNVKFLDGWKVLKINK